jgi:superfamily I DNA and/or RNA helicase
MHDEETNRILELLQKVPELTALLAPFMWIDHDSQCHRNTTTHSLYNPNEARKTATVALAIGNQIGDEHVHILTPYRGQVKYIIINFIHN